MVDVVSDQTEISYAESTTGWSGDSFSLENEILVQGSNSVACIQTQNGANNVIFTKASGSWDMTNATLRLYMSSNIMPNTNTQANDGIQMFAGDGSNTAYWTVGGKDTYSGGWQDFFIDVESTPTSGSVDTSIVERVGILINTSSKPRNSTNGWYDNWRFGDGLEINSDAAEAIDFTDVAVDDALVSNAYDILQDVDGVLFGKGKLTLGNAAGSKNCNLVSLNETIYFVDRVISSTLYGIISSEGTGTTDIDITGLTCKTVGVSGAELDFSAAITSFSIKGSSFSNMGTMQFPTGTLQTSKFTACGTTDIVNGLTADQVTWDGSDAISVNTSGAITNSVIVNCIAAASITATTLDNITGNLFTSDGSNHAVELSSIGGGSMTWDNETTGYVAGLTGSPASTSSTGNETIYVNVGVGTLTINVASGATVPSIRTAGATVNVVAGLSDLKFTLSESLTNYEWRIYTVTAKGSLAGSTEVAGEEQATVDNQTYSYTYSAGVFYAIQFIPHLNDYEETTTYYDSSPNNQNVTIKLKPDINN